MKCCGDAIVAMVRLSFHWNLGGVGRRAIATAKVPEERETMVEDLLK